MELKAGITEQDINLLEASNSELPVQLSEVAVVPAIAQNLSEEEINSAAKELGMTKINVGRLRKYADVTGMLEKIGAIQVAGGIYLAGMDARENGIEKCQDWLLQNEVTDKWCVIAQTFNALLNSREATAKELVKLIIQGKIKDSEPAKQNRLRPKNSTMNLTQVNITVPKPQQPE